MLCHACMLAKGGHWPACAISQMHVLTRIALRIRYYGREIAAYDIKTLRCDVYGEGSGFRERGMVIYDGLHYDALSIAAFENAPEEIDVSIFDPLGPQGEPANRGAQEIAKQVTTHMPQDM